MQQGRKTVLAGEPPGELSESTAPKYLAPSVTCNALEDMEDFYGEATHVRAHYELPQNLLQVLQTALFEQKHRAKVAKILED